MTTPRVEDIDLTDVDLFANGFPADVFKRLRAEAPVHYNKRSWGPGFWNVTKYQDVIQISIDPQTFISGQGIILDNSGVRTQRQREMENTGYGLSAEGNMMIMSDPPKHTRLRQIVNKGFTHKAVKRIEDHIRNLTTRILDDVCEQGECDFVLDISRKLPLEVICEMVGVPDGDWEAMFELTNRVIGFDDPEFQMNEDFSPEDLKLSMDLFQYMNMLIEERKTDPREDVLSVLVNTEMDGSRLDNGEIFMMFLLLIVAGNETTRNATTGGILAMINNPDQRQRLLDDPSLLPFAVDEVVRYISPVMHFYRTATKDTVVGGQEIKAGDQLTMWYGSANRDEDVFEDGERFDVGRRPNEHIAFGKGEHFCLGANLARLELRIMFEQLLKRMPDMELAGEPERLRSNFIHGIKRMPVRFTPSAKVGS